MSLIEQGKKVRRKQYEDLLAQAAAGKRLTPAEIKQMAAIEAELQDEQLEEQFFSIAEVEEYSGYKRRTVYDAVKRGDLYRQQDKTFAQSDVDAWLRAKGKVPAGADDDQLDEYQEHDGKKEEARFRHFREPGRDPGSPNL